MVRFFESTVVACATLRPAAPSVVGGFGLFMGIGKIMGLGIFTFDKGVDRCAPFAVQASIVVVVHFFFKIKRKSQKRKKKKRKKSSFFFFFSSVRKSVND
jgi:hypothetical protein